MRLDVAEDLRTELLAGLEPRIRLRGPREETSIAVGIATTERPGDYDVAIRPRRELSDMERSYIESIVGKEGNIDVYVTGDIVPLSTAVRPGIATAHRNGRVGTLGFFARRRRDKKIGFVSNNHVIAAEDAGGEGDEVVLPASDRSQEECVIGHLDASYPPLVGSRDARTVDCAFATLARGVDYDPTFRGERLLPDPIAAEVAAERRVVVSKIGQKTGKTRGRVTAFRLDEILVNYSVRMISFRSQIEIGSLDEKAFSCRGDSGSLIYTVDRHPLALLFACSTNGGPMDAGRTYANPIQEVLDTLGVEPLT